MKPVSFALNTLALTRRFLRNRGRIDSAGKTDRCFETRKLTVSHDSIFETPADDNVILPINSKFVRVAIPIKVCELNSGYRVKKSQISAIRML